MATQGRGAGIQAWCTRCDGGSQVQEQNADTVATGEFHNPSCVPVHAASCVLLPTQHFVAWQQITAIKKIEKHMFAEFQKKMQLMALMKPKPSKYNSQAVFNAWRLFVALAHAQKLQWKLAATKEYVDCQRQQGV